MGALHERIVAIDPTLIEEVLGDIAEALSRRCAEDLTEAQVAALLAGETLELDIVDDDLTFLERKAVNRERMLEALAVRSTNRYVTSTVDSRSRDEGAARPVIDTVKRYVEEPERFERAEAERLEALIERAVRYALEDYSYEWSADLAQQLAYGGVFYDYDGLAPSVEWWSDERTIFGNPAMQAMFQGDPERRRAEGLDAADPLAPFRERFYLPEEALYLDGNSLGLLSREAEMAVLKTLEQWRTLGIDGWLRAEPDWFTLGERLGAMMAPLVGAAPEEVVTTGTTTVNLHALVATFYAPEGRRRKIVAGGLDFPSDVYALQSQILLRGGDPERDLVLVPSRDGRTLAEDDLIAAMSDEVALVLLPSVLYRSGQLLDMARLTAAAHERGALIGFDCAHSVGVVPHELSAWGVDFAVWCTYKYLNGGPGAVGALYVNRRHFGRRPGLAGWWGYAKERQFDMLHAWSGAAGAGAWQISTPPVLATAPLLGALRITLEAGIDRIREKSLQQTGYLMQLLEAGGLLVPPYGYRIGTPRAPERRGGHVAVEHDAGPRIARALKRRAIIPDFRPPDIIRLAPIPLYTSYEEIRQAVGALRDVIDMGEHLKGDEGRELVA
jgi:kynureninase